jgi:NADPH:quinone reductase-like Zn-dependent oxidoreductase
MRAARVHQFGGPEVITLESVPMPSPAEDEILVRVEAAGVGPWDAWVRSGRSAVPQPLPLTLGADISGVVECIGSAVTVFSPGDAVYGVTNKRFTGANAEFAVASAAMMARKPAAVSHLQAAGVPVVAVTA